jgi:hypothetical protein
VAFSRPVGPTRFGHGSGNRLEWAFLLFMFIIIIYLKKLKTGILAGRGRVRRHVVEDCRVEPCVVFL